MKKLNVIAIVLYLTFLMSLNIGISAQTTPVNIVIILDTSDRVSDERHPGQIERDKEIIEEIVTEFEKVAKRHILAAEELRYDDRLTIVIPTQPGVPPVPRQIMADLTIADEDRENHRSLAGINTDVEERKKGLLNALDTLYEFVRQHRHTGSDIWEWFKYEAESYFFESHRNIIVCISDGYLNFDIQIQERRIPRTYMQVSKFRDDPQWEQKIRGGQGLLPTGNDLGLYNIDFLMSEIQLQTDENGISYQKDFQIIIAYWEVWLSAMRIQSTDFGKVGHPVGQKVKNLTQ